MRRALVLAVALFASPAWADAVYLDYTNFGARMTEFTTSVGIAAFSGAEIASIQAQVLTGLQTRFAPYNNVSFTTVDPGAGSRWEWVTFGLTAAPGNFGLADTIDYRNLTSNTQARVYSRNFDIFAQAANPRATIISELAAALANTAAHELGHNLGLRHFDSYGDTGTVWTVPTGGTQNTHIMGTGSTGMTEPGFEGNLDWSDLSGVKLEFANGVTTSPLASTAEQAGAHGTAGTAQGLTLQATATSGYTLAANVIGALGVAGELDYYSFAGAAGDKVTINVVSDLVFPHTVGYLPNPVLRLWDTDGTTQLLFGDDVLYSTTAIGVGGLRVLDSLILNFVLPAGGTYFFSVGGLNDSLSGTYNVLLATTGTVPEPGALALMCIGGLALATRRRRRRAT